MSHRRASRASSLALHQDHRDWRTTSRPVKASLREYLLKTGWSSGLFCGGYEEESLHGQTGSVFGFHYYYSKIHGRPPAEAEMQQYFRVSPPSVHQMILTLERRGLIERTPGQARSIRLLIAPEELPDLI